MISPPLYDTPLVETSGVLLGHLSARWRMWWNLMYDTLFRTQVYSVVQVQSPNATGFSYQMADNAGVLVLSPAAVYATGTVILPAKPFNQQQIQVTSDKDVTALTTSVAAGQTIIAAPTALTAGHGFGYIYTQTTKVWHRLY